MCVYICLYIYTCMRIILEILLVFGYWTLDARFQSVGRTCLDVDDDCFCCSRAWDGLPVRLQMAPGAADGRRDSGVISSAGVRGVLLF